MQYTFACTAIVGTHPLFRFSLSLILQCCNRCSKLQQHFQCNSGQLMQQTNNEMQQSSYEGAYPCPKKSLFCFSCLTFFLKFSFTYEGRAKKSLFCFLNFLYFFFFNFLLPMRDVLVNWLLPPTLPTRMIVSEDCQISSRYVCLHPPSSPSFLFSLFSLYSLFV